MVFPTFCKLVSIFTSHQSGELSLAKNSREGGGGQAGGSWVTQPYQSTFGVKIAQTPGGLHLTFNQRTGGTQEVEGSGIIHTTHIIPPSSLLFLLSILFL